KTGPDGRVRIALGPVDEPGEVLPVRLASEIGRERLGACDDEAVETALEQRADWRVRGVDDAAASLRAWNAGQREHRKPHGDAGTGGVKKTAELPFGRLERRVGH